jgi:photosystem II stability/assembly factor-like uncharacterized protein
MINSATIKTWSLIAMTLLFSGQISNAQKTEWISVDPGGNGWLTASAMHPVSGDLYLSTDMRFSLFRSTDLGDTWDPISNVVPGTFNSVVGHPSDENIIYGHQVGFIPESSGIWKSRDKGDTWEMVFQSQLFGTGKGESGAIHPGNTDVMYWTAEDGGIMKSEDGGRSWKDHSNGLPKSKLEKNRHLNALEINGENGVYYPSSMGLYFLAHGSNNWKLLRRGLPQSNCTDIQLTCCGVLYASFPSIGLFRSLNNGKKWTLMTNGLDGKSCFRAVAVESNPDIVYVATTKDRGVYRSDDRGESFELVTHYKFDKGYNWPLNYRQMEAVSAQHMFIHPVNPDTLIMDYNKKTYDGGKTWLHYGTKHMGNDRWAGTGLALLTEYKVAFNRKRPGVVWMGFSDTGIMLTEDGGESIINVASYLRGEVNQAAYWRDKLVNTSGSCQSLAVDPVRTNTIYASINAKEGSRKKTGGTIIKSVDGGWNWSPIYEKNGLADGIVRSIVIDPGSPIENRALYVAVYGKGVYKSINDGNNFSLNTPVDLFNENRRLMDLEMAPSDNQTLYLAVGGSKGIRPIRGGKDNYPVVRQGMFGGVFKTDDGGSTWKKCNATRELPSVQDIAIHPENENIVYAAVYPEDFMIRTEDDPDLANGGLFVTRDGGKSWEMIFDAPDKELFGKGLVQAVVVNPLAPEIVYVAVEPYGIYRTLNAGESWELVGEESMNRKQRIYHSVNINPHNLAEVWVAPFGSSFLKAIDRKAEAYLTNRFAKSNFVRNGGFEKVRGEGILSNWHLEQPPQVTGEDEVITVVGDKASNGDKAVRFNLTQAHIDAPSPWPAYREYAKMNPGAPMSPSRRETGETQSWLYQNIDPYFTTLMRGKKITIEMDVLVEKRELSDYWERGSEMGETPRNPPQVFLSEARDFNVHWMVAEASLDDTVGETTEGTWMKCRAEGVVSEDAQWLRVTLTGVWHHSLPMDVYVDNVSLTITE